MKFLLLLLLAVGFPVFAAAQDTKKIEPKRIYFGARTSSVTLSGVLSNAREMDYVFAARQGQKLTIKNARTSLFDFRIFSEEFDVETEFDSSRELTIEIPATGDYLFFVRKKLVARPRTARFQISLWLR